MNKELKKSEYNLNKPNQLICLTSQKQITLVQRKLYNCFLKKAQDIVKFERPEEEINEKQIYCFEIPCITAHEKANIKIKDHDYVEKELEALMQVVMTVREEDNKTKWDKFTLLSRVKRDGDKYEYYLFGNIVKALKEQNFFTALDIMTVNLLNSQYSVIFYELAIRYEKMKIPKKSIKEIREMTGTTKEYSRFQNFKTRVLDSACIEISEKTDIILTYKLEKIGRNVAFVQFLIEQKKEKKESSTVVEGVGQLDFSGNVHYQNDRVELKEVRELFALVRSNEQINSVKTLISEIFEEYGFEKIQRNILYSNQKSKDNYQAFLRKAIANDYGLILQEKKELRAKTSSNEIEALEEEYSGIADTNQAKNEYELRVNKMLEEDKRKREIERIEKEAKYKKAYGHLEN